jgi:hypothetical protein
MIISPPPNAFSIKAFGDNGQKIMCQIPGNVVEIISATQFANCRPV